MYLVCVVRQQPTGFRDLSRPDRTWSQWRRGEPWSLSSIFSSLTVHGLSPVDNLLGTSCNFSVEVTVSVQDHTWPEKRLKGQHCISASWNTVDETGQLFNNICLNLKWQVENDFCVCLFSCLSLFSWHYVVWLRRNLLMLKGCLNIGCNQWHARSVYLSWCVYTTMLSYRHTRLAKLHSYSQHHSVMSFPTLLCSCNGADALYLYSPLPKLEW